MKVLISLIRMGLCSVIGSNNSNLLRKIKESGISVSQIENAITKNNNIFEYFSSPHTKIIFAVVAVADIEVVLSEPTVGLLLKFLLQIRFNNNYKRIGVKPIE